MSEPQFPPPEPPVRSPFQVDAQFVPPSYQDVSAAGLQKLMAPAITMLVLSATGIRFSLAKLVPILVGGTVNQEAMEPFLNAPEFQEFAPMFRFLTDPRFSIGTHTLYIALLALALFGAVQMKDAKSYSMAIAAAIITLIPCFSACCFVGIPVGIWALVVLTKPEVKALFP